MLLISNDYKTAECVFNKELEKIADKLPKEYQLSAKTMVKQNGTIIERTANTIAEKVYEKSNPGLMTDINKGILTCFIQNPGCNNDVEALKCLVKYVNEARKNRLGVAAGENDEEKEISKSIEKLYEIKPTTLRTEICRNIEKIKSSTFRYEHNHVCNGEKKIMLLMVNFHVMLWKTSIQVNIRIIFNLLCRWEDLCML